MQENFNPHQKALFRKYLNNECTQEELTQLFACLRQSPDQQAYEEILEDLWKRLNAGRPMNPVRADKIFNEIVSQPKVPTVKKSLPRLLKPVKWQRIAAVFIGLLIVSFFAYQYLSRPDIITYQTAYGETREFWLPDSSKVTLNGNSSLSYHAGWEEKTAAKDGREVWLEGEGYFEVREMEREGKVKFTVHTAHLNVEVLGTAFNVTNQTDKTQVVLSEGKVKLALRQEEKQQEIFMEPGDMVAFDAKANKVQQKVVNPTLYSSWKEHQLIFEDTPVSEINQVLEERYGLEVQLLDKEIGTRKFTGTVSTEEIELLLKAMASSFGLKITQKGNQITLQYQ